MAFNYTLTDTSSIYTPGLLFYKDLIRQNIQRCIDIAGHPDRLRPHIKTHKTREIIRMKMEAGITKFKCATIAEAELLATCGAADVFLAYNMVGPNCDRMVRLMDAYPQTRFMVTADHLRNAQPLSRAVSDAGMTIDVLMDIDVGQHRTGIAPGDAAAELYQQLSALPGLSPRGFHVYDGHNRQSSPVEREELVNRQMEMVLAFRRDLENKGLPVDVIVAGGTPTFPMHAKSEIPGLECSPGTCILHDDGYGSTFADVSGFVPAAVLLTRVISKPTATRLTLDLGYKAVASDPPAGKRLRLLDLAEYEAVLQNEEHLVVETPSAAQYQPGDELYAIPTHICPTSAMHQFAYIVEDGKVIDRWAIAGRDRVLSV